MAKLREDAAVLDATRADLGDARTRSAGWTFARDSFGGLRPGLERIYSRGRKAMRRAETDPSDEHMHEWGKRAKDLWHAVQIVRPASPKRLKLLAQRAHELSDLLGDDHDLAVLRREIERGWRKRAPARPQPVAA
jgi:hypothetical protein